MVTLDDILSLTAASGEQLFTNAEAETLAALHVSALDDLPLTPGHAAAWLGIGRSTLRAWTAAGRVPTMRLPGRTLYRLGDLRAVERPRIGNPTWISGRPRARSVSGPRSDRGGGERKEHTHEASDRGQR